MRIVKSRIFKSRIFKSRTEVSHARLTRANGEAVQAIDDLAGGSG